MAPKGIDPVARFAQEAHLLFMLFLLSAAFLGGHVGGIGRGLGLIKNRGVISAVKRNVCLDEEMVSEHLASVAQQDLEDAGRFPSLAPGGYTGLDRCRQAETDRQ